MKKKYDAIVVLGYEFSDNEELPVHVHKRIEIIVQLYNQGYADYIALCGKWSISKDARGIVPTTTEAELMKNLLLKAHIPASRILKEEQSKDTIGNAFFLKKDIIEPYNFKKFLVVCADYHLKRVQFVFQKIFAESYIIDYLPTETDVITNDIFLHQQQEIFTKQKNFLRDMSHGDDTFLQDKLYTHPFYSVY